MDGDLAAFVVFTFILAVTPGMATAVIIRNTLDGGRRAAFMAAAGAAASNASYAVATALGLSALVARVPIIADVIRFGGATYLGLLGMRNVGSALVGRARSRAPGEPDADKVVPAAVHTPFVQGYVANLLNPPVATFYLAVIPSFLPARGALQPRYALYVAIHIVMAFCCHCAWATSFHALRGLWHRPAARRAFDAIIGLALLALALRLLRT